MSVTVLDNRLKGITPPSKVTHRFPRPISVSSAWKANEWRNWLFCYSLPCLKGLLPKRFYEHFAVLVVSVYGLLGEAISFEDVDYINNAMDKFLVEYEVLYGKINMTYNVHLLKHLAKNVSLWGPLWAYSAFVFENNNGILLQLVKGTTGIPTQIVKKY